MLVAATLLASCGILDIFPDLPSLGKMSDPFASPSPSASPSPDAGPSPDASPSAAPSASPTLAFSWTSGRVLPSSVYTGSVSSFGNFIYLVLGYDHSSVQYAAIQADGSIGPWAVTSPYGGDLMYFSSLAYNDYLYKMGGAIWGSSYATVQFAKINADGSLGAWASTTSLPAARCQSGSAVFNGYVYDLGGFVYGPNAYIATVSYARANSDGTLGAWSDATPLPTARGLFGTVACNGYLYILGGNDGTVLSSVHYARINPDGSLGAWISATPLTSARAGLNAFASNNRIYVSGGSDATTQTALIQYAEIQVDGSLGTWITASDLPSARNGHGVAVIQNSMYVLGGYAGSSHLLDAWYSIIPPGGV